MTNSQIVNKIFKCSVCAKADYKQIIPGSVTFFNRCTFTPDCAGLLAMDPNAIVTPRSHLTWSQTPVVFKASFSKTRILTVAHNFGHVGSIVIEVFVESVSASGTVIHAKTTNFKLISQTANTISVDLLTQHTGVIVVTSTQYNSPIGSSTNVTWSPPTLLTANIMTIAADIEVSSFTATLTFKTLMSNASATVPLVFQSHYLSTAPIGGTIWSRYRVLAIEKPYFLYSTIIPTNILQKGTTLRLSGSPTIVWPMAVSGKTAPTDVVRDKLIRNSTIRLGDLVVDNTQLVIANSSIIEQLRKQFTIY